MLSRNKNLLSDEIVQTDSLVKIPKSILKKKAIEHVKISI